MATTTNSKYPPNLVLIAILSGSLTIIVSLLYVLLCVVFIVFRFNCDAFAATTGSGYLWYTVFTVYGLKSTCEYAYSINTLMQEATVLTLVAITLAFSVLNLAAGICLVTIIQDERQSRFLKWVVYAYTGTCIAVLIVDITTATHFGIDHTFLTSRMGLLSPGSASNYLMEVLRQGTLWLMVISMKGFVVPVLNCVFLVLLLLYTRDYLKTLEDKQHPIHKVGVLSAFDSKKSDETWTNPDIYNNSPFSRGQQMNGAFIEDDSPPRSPHRRPEPPRSDYYSNLSFDRSNSWHRPQSHTPQNARVFSYLEDIRRPPQPPPKTAPAPSPAVENSSSWRRDQWPQPQSPPVPAPDYSPTQPRRLKSALKPGYM